MTENFKTITQKLKKMCDSIRTKPVLLCGMGCFVLFCFAFFTIYFVRVVYEPQWIWQINGTLVLFGILSIIISLLPNGSGVEVSKIACWLAFWSMVIVAIFAYCERLRKKRKKEIVYYQTLLNIIESIEKEKAKDEDNNK